MESLDYWRFCEELTVVQAALLVVGHDPSQFGDYVQGWRSEDKPVGYVAVISALQHSIILDRLEAAKVYLNLDYQHPDVEHPINRIDWNATLLRVDKLKTWLAGRGLKTGFFFPEGPVTAEYLDRSNPNFSAKLASAVEAWKAIGEDRAKKSSGRSVKSDLTKWLNLHAAEYGLTNDQGEPNKQAIDEVAKVANWNPKGGAPKTPGEVRPTDADELDPPF
jgi:hypothetical protein